MMTEAKFKQAAYSACVFYHEERNIIAVVHGDDFTVSGRSGDLYWFRKMMEKRMEVKYKERLSRDRDRAVRVLIRVVSSTQEGIEREADQRHAEIIIRGLGLKDRSNGVSTSGVNDDGGGVDGGEDNETMCSAIVVGANYLAQDRPRIQLAVK